MHGYFLPYYRQKRILHSSGFSAKWILTSASAVSTAQKWREESGKDDIQCTGKVEISMVEFLAAGETYKAKL